VVWYVSQTPARHLPFVPQVLCAVVAHFFCGSAALFGTATHMPNDPARLHAWQAALQGPTQQTPCEQYCLPSGANWHSVAALHWAPRGFKPQDPFTQVFGAMHCAFDEQTSKHLVPLQAKGAQGCLAGGIHWPLALQVAAGVYAFPTQVSAEQAVSTGYLRQAPAPSHFPLVPHDAAPVSLHWACGSVAPAATFLH
jgi:hypothetical protein